MANLYEILDGANGGEALSVLGSALNLTPEQAKSAVDALLPALSLALKQSTASVDGVGNLLALLGQQQDLPALYDDAKLALSPEGLAAGNQALSFIFGSPDVHQAVVDQAQKVSGVNSAVLNKLLPALTGIVLSGLLRTESAPLAAQGALTPLGQGGPLGDILGQVLGRVLTGGGAPAPAPSSGGAGPLGDILGQIFGRGATTTGTTAGPAPSSGGAGPLGDILGQIFGRDASTTGTTAGPAPSPSSFPSPADTGGQSLPGGGGLLGAILNEVLKGIQNGTIKPVIIGGGGPIQIPTGPDGTPQVPGGDIFGQVLKEILGGALGGGAAGGGAPGGGPVQIPQLPQGGGAPAPTRNAGPAAPSGPLGDLSDLTKQLGVVGGAGAAFFGDQFDHGQDADPSYVSRIQHILGRSPHAQQS